MKKHLILFTVFFYLLIAITHAGKFNKIIAFGDSLSDNGNLYQYTQGSYPPDPPYFEGHFSNGKIWIEDLVEALFPTNPYAHLKDYAIGGAGIATDEGAYFSLQAEIETYLQDNNGKVDPNTLFFVWIGSNNYFGLLEETNPKELIEQTTTQVVSALQTSLEILSKAGAKNIVVLNLPDLGKTPRQKGNPLNQAILSEAVLQHNVKLEIALERLKIQNSETQWIFIDAYHGFYNILQNPEKFGFSNATEPCVQSDDMQTARLQNAPMLKFTVSSKILGHAACDGFVFFDPVHPTERFHAFIAQLAKEMIDKYVEPELNL